MVEMIISFLGEATSSIDEFSLTWIISNRFPTAFKITRLSLLFSLI